ncbi:hypothetical protein HMPREF1097_05045, partial [Enterocloster bolteae 90B8]
MGLLSRMSRAAKTLSKYYSPFTWRDKPSIESPINAVHLNHMEDGINEMDNRILILAQDKADAADMANVIIDFTMDDTTGVMTFTRFDGSTFTHDTAVEKIALNCYLEGDNFVLELADGTKQKVSLSKFIDTYTFTSTDRIRFTVNGKNISADIPDGKITLAKLEPTVMSTIRQYTLDAQTSKGVAEQAASTAQGWAIGGTGFEGNNAKYYASKSQRYAVGGVEEGDAKDNAKAYCEAAKGYAEQCAGVTEFDGTATSVKATDTQGLVVAAGADSNAQALLDALARKVALELVSNTALTTKLADYLKKTDIVQTESTDTNKVPSSAYLKQVKDSIDSNLEWKLNGTYKATDTCPLPEKYNELMIKIYRTSDYAYTCGVNILKAEIGKNTG